MSDDILHIGDEPGFTPHIGRLVGMMRYVRHMTVDAVSGMSVAQLDHLHDPDSNSIGALLLHAAAVEDWYQANSIEEREWTDEEQDRWGAALDLGDAGRSVIRGHELSYYLDNLEDVRSRTLDGLRQRDDAWLAAGEKMSNHFKWFHVFEDEINHRGQIMWLRKRLPDYE